MPKSRGRKGRQGRSQPPKPQPKSRRCSLWVCNSLKSLGRKLAKPTQHLWGMAVAISVIVTLAGLLFLFPPRVTIDSLGEFDADDPLSASIVIRNAWVLPLAHVQVAVNPCSFFIGRANIRGDCSRPTSVNAQTPKWQ